MATETPLYIIQGSTGQYSDRSSWIAEAHLSPELANKRLTVLRTLCKAQDIPEDLTYDMEIMEAIEVFIRKHPEGDPNFQCDYPGTTYRIIQTKLITP